MAIQTLSFSFQKYSRCHRHNCSDIIIVVLPNIAQVFQEHENQI